MRNLLNADPKRYLLPWMTVGLMGGILVGRVAEVWVLSAVGLVVSLGMAAVTRAWERGIALVLAAACAGCLMSFHAYHPTLPDEGEYVVTGIVAQEISLRDDGQVQTRLTAVTLDGTSVARDAYWTYYLREDETLPAALQPGTYICITAHVYHPSGEANPGGFDFREYLLQRGMTFGLYGAEDMAFPDEDVPFSLRGKAAALRHRLSAQLMEVMGPHTGAYAAAMLLGERHFLPDEETSAFRKLGIAHILSVSGYHVGVLSLMLATLLRPLHLRRGLRLTFTLGLLVLYCLLTGMDAPIVRAAFLYFLLEFSRLRHSQRPPLHILCFGMAIQLIVSPPLLCSASFQLSYGAMFGILLVRPVLLQWMTSRSERYRGLAESVALSLAAQLGILPVQLYWFGELPLLALLANVVLLSFINLLMVLYWMTLAVLPIPGLRMIVGGAASIATDGMIWAVRTLSHIGGTSLWTQQVNLLTLLGWGMLFLGLSILLPRIGSRLRRPLIVTGTALLLASLIPLPHHSTEYIQFSVGEADAALIHDEGIVAVIDVGEDGKTLSGYLHDCRMTVDMLFLTHLHTDHAGGIQALLDDGIPVRDCYLPAGAEMAADVEPDLLQLLDALAATGTHLHQLSAGDVLPLPNGTLTCLWPHSTVPLAGFDANHSSMALLADLRGTTLLLTGDLTHEYEMNAAVHADVLKAAHHGSRGSTSTAFLEAVAPQMILLSCGDEDRHTSLAEHTGDIPLYDTNIGGAVTIRIEDERFTVETYLSTKEDFP